MTETFESNQAKPEMPESHETMVRLRGLPYNVTHDAIRQFFEDIPVTDIKMASSRDGRPSGECYCYLNTKEDVDRAVATLNRKELNQRYIEVFVVSAHEAEGLKLPGSVISTAGTGGNTNERVIRMRGLPFSATEEDIRTFLSGLACDEVVIGQTGGRPSGEAYVRLATKEHATQALELNRKTMGTRYIEIFRTDEADLIRHRDFPNSSGGGGGGYRGGYGSGGGGGGGGSYGRPPSLMSIETRNDDGYGGRYDSGYGGGGYGGGGPAYPSRRSGHRPGPYDRNRGRYESGGIYDYYGGGGRGGGGDSDVFRNPNAVFMRGIPFDVHATEIERFFAPYPCYNIKIGYNRENRPSGDAAVEFEPQDVPHVFAKNRQYLGRRYVELFGGRDAPPPMRSLIWKDIGGSSAPPPPPPQYPPYGGSAGGYGAPAAQANDYYGETASGYDTSGYDTSSGYDNSGYGAYQGSYGYGTGSQEYKASYSNGGGYAAARAAAAPPPPPPPTARDPYGGAYDRTSYY